MADKIRETLDLADRTGVSDLFAFSNEDELKRIFDGRVLFQNSMRQENSETKFPTIPPIADPQDVPVGPVAPLTEEDDRPVGVFELTALESKPGLFERMFGYNPENDLPWGYERMTDMERVVYRAQLGAQNIATRTALGVTAQLKGSLQLVLPKSMEQYLPDNTEINPDRLPEDKFYEKRIQNELRSKTLLSDEEAEELAYLDETLPSNAQRAPEFIGRVVGEIERIAVANELFKTISMAGGGFLDKYLSEAGKRLIGRRLASLNPKGKVSRVALDSLVRQVEELGSNVGTLFTWGAITAEKPEDVEAEKAGQFRIESGLKMSAWAALPILLVPSVKGVAATRAGEFVKRVFAKTASPIANQLARLTAANAKRKLFKQGLVEMDDLFFKENGRFMTSAEKKTFAKTMTETLDKAAKILSGKDVTAKINALAGDAVGSRPVGAEKIVKGRPDVVGKLSDALLSQLDDIKTTTGLTVVELPNGKFSIINTRSLEELGELATNVTANKLPKVIDNILFGKGGISKDLPVLERAKIQSILSRHAKEFGVKLRPVPISKTVKQAAKLTDASERLQTVVSATEPLRQNREFMRKVIQDVVPKSKQAALIKATKAVKDNNFSEIAKEVNVHIEKASIDNSLASLKETMAVVTKKFRDPKTGVRFAKAPDDIRELLTAVDDATTAFTKKAQVLPETASKFVNKLSDFASKNEELLGLPQGLARDIYKFPVGKQLTADEVGTITDLAKMVVHRAERARMVKFRGASVEVTRIVDDSLSRIIPRKIKPQKQLKGLAAIKGFVKRLFGVDSDHPITLIEKMFGKNSNMAALLDDLYQGEDEAFGVLRRATEFTKGAFSGFAKREDIRAMLRKGVDIDDIPLPELGKFIHKELKILDKKVSVKLGGQIIDLSKDDILGLYASMRDPWLAKQMLKTTGYDIGGMKIGKVTTDELADVFAKLSIDEKILGSIWFELNNTVLAPAVNKTSLAMNGIKIATYPQYYPSHRALNKTIYGNKWNVFTAETQSNFLPRVGGTGRLRINPYTKELMNSIQNTANYHGLSEPMRSIKTVLSDKKLQATLQNAGYTQELNNLIGILTKSEGLYSDSTVLDAMGSSVLNRFTKGILGGRISTIGTQIQSFPAAKSIIPAKYFTIDPLQPLKAETVKVANELIDRSNFFWYRWKMRKVSIEMGDVASESAVSHLLLGRVPLSEKPLTGLIWGDKMAITRIHQAAVRMVADTTKLTGDDAVMAAVKITEDAVRFTQPNWSILTRSALATDPSVFKRSLTMFRTAQEAQLNIIKRANADFSRQWNIKGVVTPESVTELAKQYESVIESQLRVSLWKSTWKHARVAGLAKVGAWMGYHQPEDDRTWFSDVQREMTRTAAGIVPLGQLIETAMEGAFDELTGEGARYNLTVDPITTMTQITAQVANSSAKWARRLVDRKVERIGFTDDFLPVDVADLLDDIATSEADRKAEERVLINQLTKDIVKALRVGFLITGAPVGPIDEWVAPALKRSPYALVHRVNSDNSSDPSSLQRDLHEFLKLQAALKKKSDSVGLTEDEANAALTMKAIRSAMINPVFAVDDVVQTVGSLDVMTDAISQFLKENKELRKGL